MIDSEIDLKYKISLSQINAAYLELFGERAMPRALGVAFWVVFFLVLLIALNNVHPFQVSSAVLGGIAGAAGMLGVTKIRQRRLERRLSKQFDDPSTWTFHADQHEVRFSNANGQGRMLWSAVKSIRECRNGIAIVLPSTITVIPTDALPEGLSAQDFCKKINQLRGHA